MNPRLECPNRNESFYDEAIKGIFAGGFFDSTKFEEIDRVGNVYNRCVI